MPRTDDLDARHDLAAVRTAVGVLQAFLDDAVPVISRLSPEKQRELLDGSTTWAVIQAVKDMAENI